MFARENETNNRAMRRPPDDGAPRSSAGNEEQPAPIDAEVTVTIQEKGMLAGVYVTRAQHGGRAFDREMLEEALKKSGVVFGLHEDKLRQMAAKPIYNVTITIANGREPVAGVDGSIKYLIDNESSVRPKMRADGTVDYRELGIIRQATEGQVLVERTPPTPGVDGSDVLGNEIPARFGRDVPLPMGKNTVISEDGLQLTATKTGHVEFSGGKVHVMDTYAVAGDVNSGTGNITFDGSVTVRGSVLAGFKIDATGDVIVRGACEAATIVSGGNVTIGEGINGGSIRAEGDLKGRYLQNCDIEIGGNVYTDSIVNCDIHCGDSLIVSGSKGTLLGGSCSAAQLIECANIGSNSTHVPTRVEVGQDLRVQVRLREAPQESEKAAALIASLDNMIGMLAQLEEAGRLDAERMAHLRNARYTREIQYNKYMSLQEEIIELNKRLEELSKGTIVAKVGIAPGVRVVIGSQQVAVKDFKPNARVMNTSDGITFSFAK